MIKAASLESNVRNFCIVVNMARNAEEARQHFDKFNTTATRFLDVNLTYSGWLPLSEKMRRAVVKRRPIGLDALDLPENLAFQKISKSILGSPRNLHGGIRFFADEEEALAGT